MTLTNKNPVVWGVLGVSGHYRKRCAVPLTQSEILDMHGVASRSQERADAAAVEFQMNRGYGSYQALLDDPAIEAVFIPLPNHMHLEWIKRAADAGKHILCEKPLGMNAGQAKEAIEYAASKNVMLMEAFMYRFHPQWQAARNLVSHGEIGSLQAVHAHFFYNNLDPTNIRNQKEAGGGGIMDIGCYAVSSSRFLFGREPKRVSAVVEWDAAFQTDKLATAILDFGDGAHANLTVGTQTYSRQTVHAFGSGGALTVDLPFNAYPDVPLSVQVHTGVGSRTIATPAVDQYALQFEAFSRALRAGDPVPTPIQDALDNQRVLDAIFESGRTNQWVSL